MVLAGNIEAKQPTWNRHFGVRRAMQRLIDAPLSIGGQLVG
jgi:hypothetical protein